MRSQKIATQIKIISAVIAAIILVGVTYALLTHDNDTPKTPIMIVTYSGGLCADSTVCTRNHTIFSDGEFQDHAKLSSAEIFKLQDVIDETDFLQYTTDPNPNCMSYVDGTDMILSFPQKYGDKKFTLCELEISDTDTAINYITDLIIAHEPTQ